MTPTPCVICGSQSFTLLYDGMHDFEYNLSAPPIELIQCTGCGLIQLSPMPSQTELNSYYPPDYANVHGESSWLRKSLIETSYKQGHKAIQKLLPSEASILDVGCSSGHFMDLLSSMEPGWTFTGVEINKDAVEEGWKAGRKNIIFGAFEDVDLPAESFDLIFVSHVVEHVLRPKVLIEKAFRLLKPNGKLFLETPNTNTLDARLFGKYWGGWHYPRHTYLFSADNMEKFLREVGFVKTTFSTTFDIFGWAMSIQNILSDHMTLKKVNGRMPLYSFLMLAFLPVVMIQKIYGTAPGMRIVATKGQ